MTRYLPLHEPPEMDNDVKIDDHYENSSCSSIIPFEKSWEVQQAEDSCCNNNDNSMNIQQFEVPQHYDIDYFVVKSQMHLENESQEIIFSTMSSSPSVSSSCILIDDNEMIKTSTTTKSALLLNNRELSVLKEQKEDVDETTSATTATTSTVASATSTSGCSLPVDIDTNVVHQQRSSNSNRMSVHSLTLGNGTSFVRQSSKKSSKPKEITPNFDTSSSLFHQPSSNNTIYSSLICSSISPQDYLDVMIYTRGYSTKSYDSLSCGYYNEPTHTQELCYQQYLLDLVDNNDIKTLSKLLTEYGLSNNPCNYNGNTLLHYICSVGNVTCFGTLLEDIGCNIQIVNGLGQTPLHIICQQNRTELCCYMIEYILKYDIHSFHIKDIYGKCPLEYISNQYWILIKLFIESRKEEYWPIRNYIKDGEEVPPSLTLLPPNTNIIPDPKCKWRSKKLSYIETLPLLASGMLNTSELILCTDEDDEKHFMTSSPCSKVVRENNNRNNMMVNKKVHKTSNHKSTTTSTTVECNTISTSEETITEEEYSDNHSIITAASANDYDNKGDHEKKILEITPQSSHAVQNKKHRGQQQDNRSNLQRLHFDPIHENSEVQNHCSTNYSYIDCASTIETQYTTILNEDEESVCIDDVFLNETDMNNSKQSIIMSENSNHTLYRSIPRYVILGKTDMTKTKRTTVPGQEASASLYITSQRRLLGHSQHTMFSKERLSL